MFRYLMVAVGSGLLFGLMDALINANPLARRLFRVFEPIARKSINMAAGVILDLVYGFALAALFLLLQGSLLGGSHISQGLFFGLLLWFLRVAMQAASQWMMLKLPAATLPYTLISGLVEMLVLGLLYGLTLVPNG